MELLTPEQAAERVAKEDQIGIVFEKGFLEESQTAKDFRNKIYDGGFAYALACGSALNGGSFIYDTSLKISDHERNAVVDIVRHGDWHYIVLHDQKHPTDPNSLVKIWNSEKPIEDEVLETNSEVDRITFNPQESYTILSMVQDCLSRGMVANNYETDRLEKLIEKIDDPFDDFQKDLEFEVQIVVRKRGDMNATN